MDLFAFIFPHVRGIWGGGEGGKGHLSGDMRDRKIKRINERLFVYFIFDLTSKEENESW